MVAEHDMSPAASARMAALLPELLDSLRARVRRARRRRAVAAVTLLAIPAVLVPLFGSPAGTGQPAGPAPIVAAPGWTEVGDDPTVLSRCEVASTVRASWFASDDELQALLGRADKPNGLVRAGDRVFVSAAAIDPWPVPAP